MEPADDLISRFLSEFTLKHWYVGLKVRVWNYVTCTDNTKLHDLKSQPIDVGLYFQLIFLAANFNSHFWGLCSLKQLYNIAVGIVE